MLKGSEFNYVGQRFLAKGVGWETLSSSANIPAPDWRLDPLENFLFMASIIDVGQRNLQNITLCKQTPTFKVLSHAIGRNSSMANGC